MSYDLFPLYLRTAYIVRQKKERNIRPEKIVIDETKEFSLID
ncbi:hypothetical protein B4079_2297 [Bacillus cereus]|nr:hypothetical protein B4079_2297 [Bacillus cereus]